MRVFRDLELVEQLGSGIPRILASYPKTAYHFSPNFIRLVLPFEEGIELLTGQAADQATEQAEVNDSNDLTDNDSVTEQAKKLLMFCKTPRSTKEIMTHLALKHRPHFLYHILQPLIESGDISLTIPDVPKSPKQRYVINNAHKDSRQ